MKADGKAPTQDAISKLVHISPGGLRYYPRVKTLLNQSMAQRYYNRTLRNQPDEGEILQQTQAAIDHLRASGQSVTQRTISNHVGLSLHKLRQFPQIRAILNNVAEEGHLRRKELARLHEQVITEQVSRAIAYLKETGQPLTREAVGEVVGLTPKALEKYHLARPLLFQIVEEYRHDGQLRTQQRESDLLEKVRQAMKHLRESGKPLTQKAISKEIGLTGTALMYYPRFKEIYEQLVDENRQILIEQAQRREEALVEKVQSAIEQIRVLGKPLTLQNIKREVNMSIAGLRRYPRVKDLLDQVIREKQRKHSNT